MSDKILISSINQPVVHSTVNIWSSLESSRGLTAVAACWRERLGEQFEPFKTAFLQRGSGVPKGMPCPRGCGCTHEIIVTEGQGEEALSTINSPLSTIQAVCRCDPASCPDIPLAPEDIVLFELSWTKISRALGHVFGLDYKPVELGLLHTRQIGSWSTDAIPVILTIQHERAWFRTVLLELIARLRRRFILLAPTGKNLDAISQELLASSDAAFFSLDAHVVLTNEGALHLRNVSVPGELFARFTPQPRDTEQNLAARAFALVQQLETEEIKRGPSAISIFRMHCIEGLPATAIARKCRCSRTTVKQRLKLIESRTGMRIGQLRKFSAHLEKAEADFADSRAAHIHRRSLIYDDDDSSES